MPPSRCPHCGFSYAWDGRFCGHCNTPYPLRAVWNACTEPQWFNRHHPDPTDRQLLLFGCECVRSVLRFLPAEATQLLDRMEGKPGQELSIREAVKIETAVLELQEMIIALEPVVSVARSAIEAVIELGAAQFGGDTYVRVLNAIAHASAAVGLATVPEIADERIDRPTFLDDRTGRFGQGVSVFPSRLPQGLTVAEQEAWYRWLSASSQADHTRKARAQVVRATTATFCDVYRDVIPYPFEPVAFDPDWRTSTAVAIARGMAENRDFSAMPILADALQDAGCEEPEILDHCRQPGNHCRGCWVVERVTGLSE